MSVPHVYITLRFTEEEHSNIMSHRPTQEPISRWLREYVVEKFNKQFVKKKAKSKKVKK